MSETAYPASFGQQRLWFLDQLEPGTAAYNISRAFRITGPLNIPILTRAFETMVQRHESLRTVFDSVDGEARQIVLSDAAVQIPVVDLTDIPEHERGKRGLRIASEEGKKTFDLTQGPLLRAVLVRLSPEQHLLILVMHHIVTDGWSIAVLFRELTHCYEALSRGDEVNLPSLPLQYAEYAQLQREYMSGAVLEKQLGYWKGKLAGAQTILDLPTDRPRPQGHSWHGANEELRFDSGVLHELKALAKNEGGTLFMIALAAFQALLRRYTMQESILVGTPVAARNELEIENVIGLFANTLLFRADFSEHLSFRDLVRQVRAFALDAYVHQDLPFEKLVEELVPQRQVNTSPLFQVLFTFQNMPKQKLAISGLAMEELGFETGIAKLDLAVEVFEAEELIWQFEYNTDLFDQQTIRRMLGHFQNLVSGMIKNPDLPLAQIPLMSAQERHQVLTEWNRTEGSYPQACIHELFELQVERSPQALAVVCQGSQLCYQELNERANQLAWYLRQRGVGPDVPVGICMERGLEMVVAVLAALKTGAAYVPVDPSSPVQRLEFVLREAGVGCVITDSASRKEFSSEGLSFVEIGSEKELIRGQSISNPGLPQSNDQRAYVMYTSGSSGGPKGVEGTHRGAVNRFAWMWQAYPFQPAEVCCQKTNLSFVDSVWEIFGPLLAGVPNVIVPQKVLQDPEELLRMLAHEEVTRIVLVPSLLRVLLDHTPNLAQRIPRLKLWSISGEVLSVELAKRFLAAFPGATLLNIYGSSEVAADVTCHLVHEMDQTAGSVAIGKPITNTQVYLVDEYSNPVPIGIRGQILVGGEGLALGYCNRPELTRERFLPNWLAPAQSPRLFKTGDLGRFRTDGEIDYLGRADSQVKLRGMRIELGEIETILASHAEIRQAVVTLHGERGQQGLAAYLVLRDGKCPMTGELRRFLSSELPEHMIPAKYWLLHELPLLPSGKIDRKALSPGVGVPLKDEQELVSPRNEVENKLAEVWRELLALDQIGIDQNFFELGGHSLLVLQMIARIGRIFEVELPVRAVFEEPTIQGLAVELGKAQALGRKAPSPIVPRRAVRSTAGASREAILSQLDDLSGAELQSLLSSMQGKQPT